MHRFRLSPNWLSIGARHQCDVVLNNSLHACLVRSICTHVVSIHRACLPLVICPAVVACLAVHYIRWNVSMLYISRCCRQKACFGEADILVSASCGKSQCQLASKCFISAAHAPIRKVPWAPAEAAGPEIRRHEGQNRGREGPARISRALTLVRITAISL